jgi:hypothetical protein
MESRILLYPTAYRLSKVQLSALEKAARAMGDTDVILSMLDSFEPQPAEPIHWRIPITELSTLEEQRGYHLVLENILFSRNGSWGIAFLEDAIAVVGGSKQFIDTFVTLLPDEPLKQVQEFLKTCRQNFRETEYKYPGLFRLLSNLYGTESSVKLLVLHGLEALIPR